MAHVTKYKKFSAGGFWEFTYSPKYLDQLTQFDRRPLGLFFEYDTQKKYCQMINMHWLTKGQRKKFIDLITKRFDLENGIDFQVPIKGLNYMWVKMNYPIALIGWRRYFPNRIRNMKAIAFEWDPKEIEDDVINTNTQRLIGVTPEVIQKLAIRAMKSRAKTKVSHAKTKSLIKRRKIRR